MPSGPLAKDVPDELLRRAGAVRLLILDVDGVLTDGRLHYGPDGTEHKAFHARDGSAMKRLMAAGIPIAIITGRESGAVDRRAAELGVPYLFSGVEDKAAALAELAEQGGVDPTRMAHAGDDLPDLPLFAATGLAFAVPDSHPSVLAQADYVTATAGGAGAVQEICDLLLVAQGKWPTTAEGA